MELSLFLAKFFGLYMLIIAAIGIFRREQLESFAREVNTSRGLFSLLGPLQILGGLALLISHPIFEKNWTIIIRPLRKLTFCQL